MTIVTDPTKVWAGEPAALKGLINSVILSVSAIVLGNTTKLDGVTAIVTAVVAFVFPLLQGLSTRKSVTAVDKPSTLVAVAPVVGGE